MNKLLQSLLRRHRPDVPALSAYADGQAGAADAAAIERHLAACEACRAEVAGLRSLRATLGAMPQAEHPRSFRLRAADVERAPGRASASGFGVAMRLMPMVSAAAGLVFVLVLGADLAGGSGGAQMAASRADAPVQARAANTIQSAPTVRSGADSAAAGATAPTFAAGDAAPPAPATAPTAGAAFDSAATPAQAESAGNKDAAPSPAAELSATSQRQTDSGGDVGGLRITEIVAGAVALIAAAATIGWRLRRRGA